MSCILNWIVLPQPPVRPIGSCTISALASTRLPALAKVVVKVSVDHLMIKEMLPTVIVITFARPTTTAAGITWQNALMVVLAVQRAMVYHVMNGTPVDR